MQDEVERKATTLSALAEIFRFNFTPAVAAIYLKVLEPISADDLDRIATEGLMTNRWQFMPKPGEFFTQGEEAITDTSTEVANSCWAAIARYGRHNAGAAQKFMGDLAWACVERMGGWQSICEVKTSERGVFVAQFREMAKSISRKAERNELTIGPPALPSPIRHLRSLPPIGKPIE